jgi:hypothetical protein
MNYIRDGITDTIMRWLKNNNNVTFLFFYVLQKKMLTNATHNLKIHTSLLVILLPEALTKIT